MRSAHERPQRSLWAGAGALASRPSVTVNAVISRRTGLGDTYGRRRFRREWP